MKIARNSPCPCGSGEKAKRCCYVTAGTPRANTPRAVLAKLRFAVVKELRDEIDRADFEDLIAEMIRLPELDISLQAPLPLFETPEIGRARQAFDDGDYEHLDKILEHAVGLIDTPQHRPELARAVLVQRDAGRVDPKVAAAAVMDLNQPRSMLLMSALAQSIAVANGNNATPSGLLTAAR